MQPCTPRHEYVLVSGQLANGSVQVLSLDTRAGLLAPLAASRALGPAPSYLAWRTNVGPVTHVLGANRKLGGCGAETLTAADWAWLPQSGGKPPPANLTSLEPPQRGTTALTDSNYVEVSPSGRWALTAALAAGQVFSVALQLGPGGTLSLGEAAPAVPKAAVGKGAHMAHFSPCGRFVYTPIRDGDVVRQFSFNDSDGSLAPLGGSADSNAAPLPPGSGPRHIAFHPTLPVAYVINEFNPSVAIFSWDPSTGRLSADRAAQPWRLVPALPPDTPPGGRHTGAEVAVSLDGRFVYASTRGLSNGSLNVIGVFAVDATAGGALTPLAWEQGGGDLNNPRHFSLTTGDRFLLAANQVGTGGRSKGGRCCCSNGSGWTRCVGAGGGSGWGWVGCWGWRGVPSCSQRERATLATIWHINAPPLHCTLAGRGVGDSVCPERHHRPAAQDPDAAGAPGRRPHFCGRCAAAAPALTARLAGRAFRGCSSTLFILYSTPTLNCGACFGPPTLFYCCTLHFLSSALFYHQHCA